MTDQELRDVERRWQDLRREAVGGIAKQAATDIQALVDELRRRDKAHRERTDQENAITAAFLNDTNEETPDANKP